MVINIIIIKITVPCRDIRAYKLVINHYEEKQKVDTTMCTCTCMCIVKERI